MVTKKDDELKTLPTKGGTVRLRSANREVKLVEPRCPLGQLRDEQGNPTSDDCRKDANGARGWWDTCESKGHNPYFNHIVKYQLEDNWVTNPETGEKSTTVVPGVTFLVPVGDVFKAKPTRGDVVLERDYESE